MGSDIVDRLRRNAEVYRLASGGRRVLLAEDMEEAAAEIVAQRARRLEGIDWNRVVLVTQGMEAGDTNGLTAEVASDGEWEDADSHHHVEWDRSDEDGLGGDLAAVFDLAKRLGWPMLVFPYGANWTAPDNPPRTPHVSTNGG